LTYLQALEADPRITVLYRPENRHQGAARNLGIRWAHKNGYPFILFLDSDDIAHPNRLAGTRRAFAEHPAVDVVYSTFTVIDENSVEVPREKLPTSIREIIDGHGDAPCIHQDFWLEMATKIGYTNLTSATAVKTDPAFHNPFPETLYVSEDYFAWLAYAADGGVFYYSPDFPAKYRIPQHTAKDAARDQDFFRAKAAADEQALKNALDLYALRKDLTTEKRDEILFKFHFKQFCTFFDEQKYDLAHGQITKLDALPVYLKEIDFD
jgi:glycosyltransferase involved in cell wall biosynthesis